MRKQLTVGTALAAAAMLAAGGALAADKKTMKPSISVNGYYEGVVGGIVSDNQETKHSYMSVENGGSVIDLTGAEWADTVAMTKRDDKKDTSALDTKTDAEIHFNGRATLDSGMKVHMRVELEGQNNHSMDGSAGGDVIDEYFLSVSGSFGQIILGGTEGAAVKMLTGLSGSWATGVGENLSFDDGWVGSASGHPVNFETLRHSRLSTGDGEKVSYISPKLGGFQIGVTYEPRVANNDDNARVNAEMDRHDAIHGAASYSGKFGDVGFGGGVGWLTAKGSTMMGSDNEDDMKAWIAVARLDFGPARIAAAYKRTVDPEMLSGHLVDLGVRYTVGANSFSLTGMQGKMKDTDAEHTKLMASYARALGPGVKWHANIVWNTSQSAESMTVIDASSGNEGNVLDEAPASGTSYVSRMNESENSGTAIVTGIKVSF